MIPGLITLIDGTGRAYVRGSGPNVIARVGPRGISLITSTSDVTFDCVPISTEDEVVQFSGSKLQVPSKTLAVDAN